MRPRRHVVLPLFTFVLVTGAVLLTWNAVEDRARVATDRQLRLATDGAARRLETFVLARLTAVEALRYRQEVDSPWRPDFARDAEATLAAFAGMQAINWSDRDGVIRVVVPPQGNLAARGRSTFEHPQAGPVAREVAATLQPRVTGAVSLYQGGQGFAAIYPVVRDGELEGFVNGVFELRKLVETCFPSQYRDAYGLQVHDGPTVLYDDLRGRDGGVPSADILLPGGKRWALSLAPTAPNWAGPVPKHDEAFLAMGLVFAAGLSFLLWLALSREAARAQMELERERLAELVDASLDPIGVASPEGKLMYLNASGRRLVGLDAGADVHSVNVVDVVDPRDLEKAVNGLRQTLEEGRWEGELRYVNRETGGVRPLEVRCFLLRRPRSGEVEAVVATAKDLSERRRLETDLRHAQKMEAVGRLAGGIAHDFNNLLTAMLGQADVARRRVPPDSPIVEHLDEIVRAARRAADLTGKLLTFSRKQVGESRPMDLGDTLRELGTMLRRLVPEDVHMQVSAPTGLGAVVADPSQLEQIVVNLVVNAAAAMPDGGELDVDLSRSRVGATDGVLLRVRDTGVGMTEEVRERIFEPFFTTKGVGKGTGLGLATVYGIVSQLGGQIRVESELGEGSAFEVWLPVSPGAVAHERSASPVEKGVPGGDETVLLVEDEPQVRKVARSVLVAAGYRVVEAANGIEALDRLGAEPDVGLLVSDVVMPEMGGMELATEVHLRRPGVRVLLCSGHSEERVDAARLRELGAIFLPKPYTPRELLLAVREAVEGAFPQSASRLPVRDRS